MDAFTSYPPTAVIDLESGFGHQLFRIAGLYSYAKKHGTNFKIRMITIPYYNSTSSHIIKRCEKMDNYSYDELKEQDEIPIFPPLDHLILETMHFDLPKLTVHTNLRCDFINPLYFKEYKNELVELFAPTEEMIKNVQNSLYYPKLKDSMFIHLRLGDITGPQRKDRHVELHKYYQRCLEKTKGPYLLFTNAYSQIASFYPMLIRPDITIVYEFEPLTVFYMMSMCGRGGICSNSTFSWMAAWISSASLEFGSFAGQRKEFMMPKKWFRDRVNIIDFDGVELVDI